MVQTRERLPGEVCAVPGVRKRHRLVFWAVAIVAASGAGFLRRWNGSAEVADAVLESTPTFPRCGHAKTEPTPTDARHWFCECAGRNAVLRPKAGNCLVFCS